MEKKTEEKELDVRPLKKRDWRIFLCSVFFVLGFSLVFSLVGVLLQSALAGISYSAQQWLGRVGGVIIILFWVFFCGATERSFFASGTTSKGKGGGWPLFFFPPPSGAGGPPWEGPRATPAP